MTLQQDMKELKKKKRDQNWKECYLCSEFVNKAEAQTVLGMYFCSHRCLEEWVEDRNDKATAFETIKTELGISKDTSVSGVVEKVLEISQELNMRKGGFK